MIFHEGQNHPFSHFGFALFVLLLFYHIFKHLGFDIFILLHDSWVV